MANGTGKTNKKGVIKRIYGPVVEGKDIPNANLYDVVKVGSQGLMGEIIKIVGDTSVIQVYEDTSGLKPGEAVENTGEPMSVELGPGILTNIYDGIQRPLRLIEEKEKAFSFSEEFLFLLLTEKEMGFQSNSKKRR